MAEELTIEERKKLFLQKYGEAGVVTTPAKKKTEASVKPKLAAKATAKNDGHTHPAAMANKVRAERVYVESSATNSTSGCEEHYEIRFVKLNEDTVDERELTSLEKIMLYGDCLLNPKYKEY